ncbi:hypothetical protein TW95_gp1267 [Pandoravirus inopinatum]|uniref:Uncharacterized protein n=1 Tax=Pandoravirus inopinatum TaxID=1605721 RepID=A0A0B5JAL8_9VIRU|nr:hypothetical protein TW95_gp1267 [Pandoravirus inopinatum]AJF98001.1 hypothetical protein [Pandoravirus inopinatum]
MDPVLCRLLDDLPVSRLFGAFERSHPTEHRLRPLFDLCLRATVPFAVVDARLQAYLPLAAPSAVVGVAGAGGVDALSEASQSLPTFRPRRQREERKSRRRRPNNRRLDASMGVVLWLPEAHTRTQGLTPHSPGLLVRRPLPARVAQARDRPGCPTHRRLALGLSSGRYLQVALH